MESETSKEIATVREELFGLPQGNMVKKNANGKTYYYRRIKTENGFVEIPVEPSELEDVREKISRRRTLEKRLKELSAISAAEDASVKLRKENTEYMTEIVTGYELADMTEKAGHFVKRECYEKLSEFVYGDERCRVFILYGLRRTGKTTLMWQLIDDMTDDYFERCAYIKIARHGVTLAELNHDLKILRVRGFRYIFVDEATFMDDFIDGASLLSDIYAAGGMKIVLSGTDSLGFELSADEELYDRCSFLHTTFIPYREFEGVLGVKGIDEYIRFGGTMSPSGTNYNGDATETKKYVDTAIAENIQNSLRNYEHGGHFRHLWDLYQQGELTSAINRVVEDMNHRFTVDVLTRRFVSHDLASSAQIPRKRGDDILDRVDREAVTERLRKFLDILNPEERMVSVTEVEAEEIGQYLRLLDLVYDIEVRTLREMRGGASSAGRLSLTVVSQPGLRYAQAGALVDALTGDETFDELSGDEKAAVRELMLDEIRGRMTEEIVLLETRLAVPKDEADVFKLQFERGEFDMVVAYKTTPRTCRIYEVKHSDKIVPEQYRHLADETKCRLTEFAYGKILGRYVIYRGKSAEEGSISYVNVEEYLCSLGRK
ncbi:MAG: AAA family ATPase [Clostridia bacterium]|nr:AAA family ATPase [Clostridia bacterium]